MQHTADLPPADELTTSELTRQLNAHLLPGATATTVIHECPAQCQFGVPRSWIIQAHKAARRGRVQDDGTKFLPYHEHDNRELLESLSVKLGFDIAVIDAAAEGDTEPLVNAMYDGLRELSK